jgi:hypothetical protein
MKRIASLILSLLVLGGGAVFAQNKGALTIQCNVTGAKVYISGRLAGYTTPNFSQLLNAGSYQIRVVKSGLPEFSTTVNMNGQPVILNVVLGAQQPQPVPEQPKPVPQPQPIPQPQVLQHSLSVDSNVRGAEVYINGNSAGRTPFSGKLPEGSYNVMVRSPGYIDFNQNVVVRGNTHVNAVLQGMSYQLNVDTGALRGAQVILNGSIVGQTPYAGSLQPGSYSLILRLPGYGDYSIQLNMNGPQTVSALLQPLAATWQLSLPDSSVNKDMRGGHWSQIQVFIDGAPVKGNQGQFFPGRHSIRVVSGGMAAETFIDAQSGRVYTIEPMLGISVH